MDEIIDHFEEDNDVKDWQLFVGNANEYYIQKWLYLKEQNTKVSFNIAAFFLGAIWMLYRKMYLETLIWVCVILGVGLLGGLFFPAGNEDGNTMSSVINIVLATIIGFHGDWIYLQFAEKKINEIKAGQFGQSAYEEELQLQGGTSFLPVFIGLGIYIFAIIMLAQLL